MPVSKENIRILIDSAAKAMEKAYAPYSHFLVGAALLCQNGTVFTACNVENAAYPCGICAERAALAKAVSEGQRDFTAMAVIADDSEICTPCGMCRQSLYEFSADMPVICCNKSKEYKIYRLFELLPNAFKASKPREKVVD